MWDNSDGWQITWTARKHALVTLGTHVQCVAPRGFTLSLFGDSIVEEHTSAPKKQNQNPMEHQNCWRKATSDWVITEEPARTTRGGVHVVK